MPEGREKHWERVRHKNRPRTGNDHLGRIIHEKNPSTVFWRWLFFSGWPAAPWLEYIPQLDDIAAPMVRAGGHALTPHAPGLGIDWGMEKIVALAGDGAGIEAWEE